MSNEERIGISSMIQRKLSFNPSPQLLSKLNSYRKENRLCDVTLQVGETQFKAHRLVLASVSSYFEAMFFSDFIESKQDVITLHNIDEKTMQHLLEFAYTGSMMIDKMNFKRLLCASHFLQIKNVYEASVKFLGNIINLENWFEVLHMAQFYKLDNLQRKAFLFAMSNFWHVEEKQIALEMLVRDIINRKGNIEICDEKRIISYTAVGKEFNMESSNEFEVPAGTKFQYYSKDGKRTSLKYDLKSFSLLLSTNSSSQDQITAANGISSMQVAVIAGGIENFNPLSPAKSRGAKLNTDRNESQWCFCFSPKTGVWFPVGTLPNAAPKLTNQTIASIGAKLYVVVNGNFFYKFDSITRVWNSLAPLTHTRRKLGLLTLNGYIYAIHGGYSSLVERYNPVENKWTSISRLSQLLFSVRAVTCQNKIYVFGHLRSSTGPAFNKLKIYDPYTDSWSDSSTIPTPQRKPALCVLDGFIYLVGGLEEVQNIATKRVQCYNAKEDRWYNVPSMINSRFACGATALNGKIYALGGMDKIDVPRNVFNLDELSQCNPVFDLIECYDPTIKQWNAAGTLPTPKAGMSCLTMSVPVWMGSFEL